MHQENQKNDNPREIDYRLFNVKEVYKHIFYNLLDADMNQVVLELVGPSYTEMSLAKTHKIYDDFIRRQAVNALGVTEEQSRGMDIQDLYTIRLYPHIQHIGLNI